MRILLTFTISLMLASAAASAASVQFTQRGWSTGGTLSVSFAGTDGDADGALMQSELTDFAAIWSTPASGEAAWTLPDIEADGFFFADLGNYLFFVTKPEFSLVSTAFEGEALASVFDQFLFPVDSSANAAEAVPEPSGLAAAGLAALSLLRMVRRPSRR